MSTKITYPKELLPKWRAERDAVVVTYDVAAFRRFYDKWTRLGMYRMKLPKHDAAIEQAMRKIVLDMDASSEKQKAEARAWLDARGVRHL